LYKEFNFNKKEEKKTVEGAQEKWKKREYHEVRGT